MNTDIKALLGLIPCAQITYTEWVTAGMICKNAGLSCDVWDEWSQTDYARYQPGECEKKWDSFEDDPDNAVGIGSLVEIAKKYGMLNEMPDSAIDWDGEFIVDESYLEPVDEEWLATYRHVSPESVEDTIKQLKALYEPGEFVGYIVESFLASDDKFKPRGVFVDRTVDELIASLESHSDLASSLGAYNRAAGAWLVANPLDGVGRRNENVVAFRWALVESDVNPVDEQLAIIRALNMPCGSITFSGNKSIQALVHVDATDQKEYKRRVGFLYDRCEQAGLHVDRQNSNPARASRLAGAVRTGRCQKLIDTNCGASSWEEWLAEINGASAMPPTDNLADLFADMPELAPPLVDGILRLGHKMILSGPSKMGKSFLLMHLTVAIAEGIEWLGHACMQGRVLYVNLEIDRATCAHRFRAIYRALGLAGDNAPNLDVLNLRGHAAPMSELAPQIIKRAKNKDYIAIIVDPIYKVLTGDENNAADMAEFTNQFDLLCNELGCSVIYCHHHSKGSNAYKDSALRMSGSGVFARDPDAILDFTALDIKDLADEGRFYEVAALANCYLAKHGIALTDDFASTEALVEWTLAQLDDAEAEGFDREVSGIREAVNPSAYRASFTLREFASPAPMDIWFTYPIHFVDMKSVLARCKETSGRSGISSERLAAEVNEEDDRYDKFADAFELLAMGGDAVKISDLADYLEISEKTVHRRVDEMPTFSRSKGVVTRACLA